MSRIFLADVRWLSSGLEHVQPYCRYPTISFDMVHNEPHYMVNIYLIFHETLRFSELERKIFQVAPISAYRAVAA